MHNQFNDSCVAGARTVFHCGHDPREEEPYICKIEFIWLAESGETFFGPVASSPCYASQFIT
jgi:hypothetical protein